MKPLHLLAAGVALALALAFFLLRSGTEPGLPAQTVVAASDQDERGSEPEVDAPKLAEPAPSLSLPDVKLERAPATAEPEEPAAAEFPGPFTQVTGRVVDQEGEPLVGARLQLRGARWPDEANVGELEPLGNETYARRGVGIETLADEAGHFRIEAPFGPKTFYELAVAADPMHDSARLRFGRDGVAAVTEGLVEVGEIRLASTGSIFGTVTDVRGQPLGGAEMDTGPERSTTYSRGSLVREDGSFVIPHAQVGTYMVKAEMEGYVNGHVDDVTIEAGRSTGPIDIILQDAPRIEGRVVDKEGAPIEGARLGGWPESHGSGLSGRTKADGSFIIFLPQDEPYSLQVTHADYEQWGDSHKKDRLFEPGSQVGTITLAKVPQVRFTVADETGEELLTSFGLKIARNGGSEATNSGRTFYNLPRVVDHADGVFTAGAKAKRDAYVAYAPGFLMTEGDVDPTEDSVAAGAPAQRILLRRGAGVEGRLMENGEPVPGASIDFTPGSKYGQGFSPQDRLSFQVTSGPDGKFRTTGLPPTIEVRLTATNPNGGAPILRMLKGLEGKKVLDLGDLEFQEGGTVLGKVLLPEGMDPSGLTVFRGDWKEDNNQVTDSAGVFRFENLAPGTHSFGQRGRPEILESGGSVEAVVEPGEATEVVLDLRSQALVEVELEVDLGGRSAAGLRVDFIEAAPEGADPTFGFSSRDWVKVGETDAEGVAAGRCRAVKNARVQVSFPTGQRLKHEGEPINVSYGPLFRERVRFSLGSLQIDLGAGRVLPDNGTIVVELAPPGAEGIAAMRSTHRVRLKLVNGEIDESHRDWASLEGTLLTLHGVAKGDWELTVYAHKKDAPRVETELPGGRRRFGAERNFEFTSHASVIAGEMTRAGN